MNRQRPYKLASEHGGRIEGMMADFQRTCRQHGLRLTPQRAAIYHALATTDEHPSAEWVYRRVRRRYPGISFDTVNRTLLKLAEIGAAFVVEGSGEARRFDADTRNHQHFRCTKCGRIADFHYAPFDDIEIPAAIRRFQVLRKTVYFEGICDRCQRG